MKRVGGDFAGDDKGVKFLETFIVLSVDCIFIFLNFENIYIYIRRERRNVEELINCIDIFLSNYLFCIELKVFRNIILIFCIRVI